MPLCLCPVGPIGHNLYDVYIFPKRTAKQGRWGYLLCTIAPFFLLATEPVTKSTADHHSYGFRPKRSAADAIERCFVVLTQRSSAQWILEGDIKGCFDNISHDWIVERKILAQWLKAGFLEKEQLFSTVAGTPQEGIISPCLANGVLDGMESMLKSMTRPVHKVHMVRYADDFVITGNSKELLENRIKPAVTTFLRERGLTLSEEKTAIVSISQEFDFLGFNVRKYGRKPLKTSICSKIKPRSAPISVMAIR